MTALMNVVGVLAFLDACSPKEKDDALAFLSGYSPDAFERCMLHVERLRKPPRIPEPGLWGVVEASSESNSSRRKWVHYGTGWRDAFNYHIEWDLLIDPVLVRDGVGS